jgi:type IV secretory pathway protease TraF
MPSLDTLARELAPQGWQFVALNHGEMPERVRRFLAEVPIHGTVLLDRSQSVFKAWGGQALPTTFVFDRAGRPLAWAQGERDWAAPEIVEALRSLPAARRA